MPMYNWLQRDSGFYNYSKGIVKPNLIIWVDAGNTGSYSGTGTVWYDLSGNSNNMSLVNCGYTGGNSILFNGTSSYTLSTNVITPFSTSNFAQTQEVWFLNSTGNGVIIDELGTTSVNQNWHASQLELVNSNLYGRLWNSASVQMSGSYSGTGTTWVYVALRYNPVTLVFDLFLNGVLSRSVSSYSRINPSPDYYVALGAGDSINLGSGVYYKGQIAIYRTYNRVLSNSEILRNYSWDLSRFSPIKSGNIAGNVTTTGLNVLSAAAGVDDGGYVFTVPFDFYFFGTNYGNCTVGAASGVYWNTNNVIGFGTPINTIQWTATTGRGILIGNYDRRTNNFYYSNKLTSGPWSYLNCVLFAQNVYSDGIPNAIRWQIRLFRSSTSQLVELRTTTFNPSTWGYGASNNNFNITNSSVFQNTFGASPYTMSANQSWVLESDALGNNWKFYANSYVNI